MRAAERREEQPAAEIFDRIVIQLVVEREAVEVLRGIGPGELGVEHNFVREAVEIEQRVAGSSDRRTRTECWRERRR